MADPWTALGYIALAAVLGATGQGIRIAVGWKKASDKGEAWYTKQAGASLALAIVIGAIAGLLAAIDLFPSTITRDFLLTLVAWGYAGTDAIEGIFQKYFPDAEKKDKETPAKG